MKIDISQDSFKKAISQAFGKQVKCLRCVQNVRLSIPTFYVECIDEKVQGQKKAALDPTDPDSAKKIYDEAPNKFYVCIEGPSFIPRQLTERELTQLKKDKQQKLKLTFK